MEQRMLTIHEDAPAENDATYAPFLELKLDFATFTDLPVEDTEQIKSDLGSRGVSAGEVSYRDLSCT